MKATGIVRRIDDLGRVVIPKEIRRTLRIREGDPLEIFTDKDGGVILKKYSPIDELSDFSNGYADSIQQSIGNIVMICDKDSIISVSGISKKEYAEKKISNQLGNMIEERKTVMLGGNGSKTISICDDEDEGKYSAMVVSPIIAEGDAIGAVLIASREEGQKFGSMEVKMAEIASSFLGKQME